MYCTSGYVSSWRKSMIRKSHRFLVSPVLSTGVLTMPV